MANKPHCAKRPVTTSVKKDLEIFREMTKKKSDSKTTHPCIDVSINHLNPSIPILRGTLGKNN